MHPYFTTGFPVLFTVISATKVIRTVQREAENENDCASEYFIQSTEKEGSERRSSTLIHRPVKCPTRIGTNLTVTIPR